MEIKFRVLKGGPGSEIKETLTPEQLFMKYGMYCVSCDGWKETEKGLVWIETLSVKTLGEDDD